MFTLQNAFKLLISCSLIIIHGCLGFRMSEKLSSRPQTSRKTNNYWAGEYSGTVKLDISKHDKRFQNPMFSQKPSPKMNSKEIPSKLVIDFSVKDKMQILINTEDGENKWNFIIDDNELITSPLIFNTSVLYLGEERNCCVTLEKSAKKLTGSIEILPKKTIKSSWWYSPTQTTNYPVGTYILDFNQINE